MIFGMHNQIPVVYKSLLDFLKILMLPASDFAIYIVITGRLNSSINDFQLIITLFCEMMHFDLCFS